MAATPRSILATVRRLLLTPVALGYLAVVAAVWIWIGVDLLFVEHQDASLSGVWGFFVTAPTSLLFVMLPGPLVWCGVVIGAFVQALALGAVYEWLKRPSHRAKTSNA